MKMSDDIYIDKLNPIVSNESSLIKFYNIENKQNLDNFISVIYSNPSNFHIYKITLDNEFYIYNQLKEFPGIPNIKSPIYSDILDNKAIYGFATDKLLINLDNEERWRRDKNPFSLDEVKSILYKLTTILEKAESMGIYHGPICLYNIIRTFSLEIKLVGWSQEHQFRDHQIKLIGNPDVTPGFWPFVCNSFKNGKEKINEYFDENVFKRDIYSLGRVVLKLLNLNEKKWEKEMLDKTKDINFINILKNILNENFEERFSLKELKRELESNNFDKCEISLDNKQNIFEFIKKVAKQKNGLKIEENLII